MKANLDALVNVKSAPSNLIIKLPTGGTSVITHVGDVLLQNGLKLHNVLYVPAFKHNLLSIHRLAADNNYSIQFQPQSCTIVDSATKEVKATGTVHIGLYYLQQSSLKHIAGVSKSCHVSTSVSYDVWHHRLGHAPKEKLSRIPYLKGKLDHSKQVCLTCPMSKFAKLPYNISMSHAAAAFDLIHVDTWGPYKVLTRGKYKYFLTIVDDHTRFTWLYLLQFKSDYLSVLESFITYIQNHFSAHVKTLRSDNALEFSTEACKKLYNKMGIVHQTSVAYRPQQNSRVERKHRSVLKIARCLRFQSGLSLTYWGECVMTAVHLLNRLPTAALENKIPYEMLYQKPADYDHLKVFGCLGFASNPSNSVDKFAIRGVPCVFIGYPATKKGSQNAQFADKGNIYYSRCKICRTCKISFECAR